VNLAETLTDLVRRRWRAEVCQGDLGQHSNGQDGAHAFSACNMRIDSHADHRLNMDDKLVATDVEVGTP
jgi:hypothetical protein